MPPPPLIAPTPSKVRPPDAPLMVMDVAAWAGTAVVATRPPAARTRPASTAVEARMRLNSPLNADTVEIPFAGRGVRVGCGSADDEVLVGARRVLALPLVQLLAQVAAAAVDVQAQTAVPVLERVRAVGLRARAATGRWPRRSGPAGRCPARPRSWSCRRPPRPGRSSGRAVHRSRPRPARTGTAGCSGRCRSTGRSRRPTGGVAVHVQAQAVAGDDELVVAVGKPATAD